MWISYISQNASYFYFKKKFTLNSEILIKYDLATHMFIKLDGIKHSITKNMSSTTKHNCDNKTLVIVCEVQVLGLFMCGRCRRCW